MRAPERRCPDEAPTRAVRGATIWTGPNTGAPLKAGEAEPWLRPPPQPPAPVRSRRGSGHRHHPIASFIQRTTERFEHIALRRQLGILLAQPRQLRPLILIQRARPITRRRLSALTQLPSVPALIPRFGATCAIGLPVSRTSRIAPSGNRCRTSCASLPSPFPLRQCVHVMREAHGELVPVSAA
jgi:hypothetical protein